MIRLAPSQSPAMALVPGWHFSLYHNDRLHCEFIGICRDFGGALIRDIVELLDTPLELVFEDLNCFVTLVSFRFIFHGFLYFRLHSCFSFCSCYFLSLTLFIFHRHCTAVCVIRFVPCHTRLSHFLFCICCYCIFFLMHLFCNIISVWLDWFCVFQFDFGIASILVFAFQFKLMAGAVRLLLPPEPICINYRRWHSPLG